jgi:hypothetical protein
VAAIAEIITSWPARFATPRARRLGLEPELSFDDFVLAYIEAVGSVELGRRP